MHDFAHQRVFSPFVMRQDANHPGMLFGRGIATTFPYEAGAFLKTRPDLLAPDVQVHFMPALENAAKPHFPKPFRKPPLEETHGFSMRVGPVNPESRGWIGLRSADPAAPALIQPNYLQDEADCRTTIAGIRMIRDVIAQPAFDAYRGTELAPGDAVQSDAELTAWWSGPLGPDRRLEMI